MNCINCNKGIIQLSTIDLSSNFLEMNKYSLVINYIENSFKDLVKNYVAINFDTSNNPLDLSNNPLSRNMIDYSDFSININDISFNLVNNLVYFNSNGHTQEQIYYDCSATNTNYIRKCIKNISLDLSGNINVELAFQECLLKERFRIYTNYRSIKDNILTISSNSPEDSLWIMYNDLNYQELDKYGNNSIILNLKFNDNLSINYLYCYEQKLKIFN